MTIFCDKLEANLVDVAFMLTPEVTELVRVHRDDFQQLIDTKREMNGSYVEEVNQRYGLS